MNAILKIKIASFYLALIAVSIKVVSVSMYEPFTSVTFNEIIWQYLVPTVILSLSVFATYLQISAWLAGSLSGVICLIKLLALVVPVLISLEAIYGYSWDLYHHAGVR